jgi:hypothetical protein
MPRYKLPTLLILLAGCQSTATVISPPESTQTAITETYARLNLFLTANQALPPDLAMLPQRAGFANQIVDGWGRQLHYSSDDDGTVSLASLGRDGAPGGVGDDADIVRRFRTRNGDGTFGLSEIQSPAIAP